MPAPAHGHGYDIFPIELNGARTIDISTRRGDPNEPVTRECCFSECPLDQVESYPHIACEQYTFAHAQGRLLRLELLPDPAPSASQLEHARRAYSPSST